MAVFKKGNDWYIDYYVNGRRKREKIGGNKRLAQTVLQKRKVEIAEDKYLDKSREAKVLFRDFAKSYLETYAVKKRSFKSFKANINRLVSEFGNYNLNEITSLMIEKFQTKRLEVLKPSSSNRELARLKHMFNKAIEWGKAKDNPVTKIKLLKENNKRLKFLTQEEFNRLVDCSPSFLKPILITACNTGMRRGEILSLKWEQINLKNRTIYLLDTKNGEKREIPINQTLLETLKSVPQHLRSSFVFHDSKGNRLKDIRIPFLRACKAAGIKDFKFHDLRHTFASHLVMAGVDLYTVKELLGHKDIQMTQRYSHLSSSHKYRAVSVLDSYMDTNTDTNTQLSNVKHAANPMKEKSLHS